MACSLHSLMLLAILVALRYSSSTPSLKPIKAEFETQDPLPLQREQSRPLQPGSYPEPVIFEPQKKVRLSRSTYRIISYVDFEPYIRAFIQFYQYLNDFRRDMVDYKKVGALIRSIGSTHPNPYKRAYGTAKMPYQALDKYGQKCQSINEPQTFECRVGHQYGRLRLELDYINRIFAATYDKFLGAIDHLEYHPTNTEEGMEDLIKKMPQTPQSDDPAAFDYDSKVPTFEDPLLGPLPKALVDDKTKNRVKEAVKRESAPRPFMQIVRAAVAEQTALLKQAERRKRALLLKRQVYQKQAMARSGHSRRKRFTLMTWLLGWGVYSNARNIRQIKKNLRLLQKQNDLQERQIFETAHYLNLTATQVREHRKILYELDTRLLTLNKTLIYTMHIVSHLRYSFLVLSDIRIGLQRLTSGLMALDANVNGVYEYLRVMASHTVNPLVLPPEKLRQMLAKIKEDMRTNPRLKLPEDPEENIWAYYPIMKVTPIVVQKALVLELSIPLIDQSLEMDIYKVYNLPALDADVGMQYQYEIENNYLAISRGGVYAALPTEHDMEVCDITEGHLCTMNRALYPVDGLDWCVYALFRNDPSKIRQNCKVKFQQRHSNLAISLDGWLWAVSPLATEKIQIRCLTSTRVEIVRPPLTILMVENGCEGYSPTLFIPATSEMTGSDDDSDRLNYFIAFNAQYQELPQFGLWVELRIQQLTPAEVHNLGIHISELPPMTYNALNQRLVDVGRIKEKYPFSLDPRVILAVLVGSALVFFLVTAFGLWKLKTVHTSTAGLKPLLDIVFGHGKDLTKMPLKEKYKLVMHALRNPQTLTLPPQHLLTASPGRRKDPEPAETVMPRVMPSAPAETEIVPRQATVLGAEQHYLMIEPGPSSAPPATALMTPTTEAERIYITRPMFQRACRDLSKQGYDFKSYQAYLNRKKSEGINDEPDSE